MRNRNDGHVVLASHKVKGDSARRLSAADPVPLVYMSELSLAHSPAALSTSPFAMRMDTRSMVKAGLILTTLAIVVVALCV